MNLFFRDETLKKHFFAIDAALHAYDPVLLNPGEESRGLSGFSERSMPVDFKDLGITEITMQESVDTRSGEVIKEYLVVTKVGGEKTLVAELGITGEFSGLADSIHNGQGFYDAQLGKDYYMPTEKAKILVAQLAARML